MRRLLKRSLTVIEPRNFIPILSCVRIREEGPRLTIEGTDLDMALKTECDVLSGGAGFDAVVPAASLYAAVKYAGIATVDLVVERETVKSKRDKTSQDAEMVSERLIVIIADGDMRVEIELSSSATDWPDALASFAGEEARPYETFSNGHFKKMLDTVAVAISTEETRYYLNGVFWEPGAFVATDGHRLVKHTYMHTCDGSAKAIIPRKAVGVLRKFAMGDVITKVYDRPKANKNDDAPPFMVFLFGGFRLTTKTIDGTYPDYSRVIPDAANAAHEFRFNGETLHEATKRILAFHKANGCRTRAVSFKKDAEGKVILTSSSMGEFRTEARTFAEWPEGCRFDAVGFNAAYLAEFSAPGVMRLRMADAGSPTLLAFEGEEDVLRVLMPMRV